MTTSVELATHHKCNFSIKKKEKSRERVGGFSQGVLSISMSKENIFIVGYRSGIRTERVIIHTVIQQDSSVFASQQSICL